MQVEKDGCTERSSPGRSETGEAEAEDPEADETGGRERRSPGQTVEGRGWEGVKAGSHLSATGVVGWRRRRWNPERLRGSSSEATRLPGEGTRREDWKQKTGG